MLVNARLVREGVAAHDGLVRLHRLTGQLGEEAAGAEEPGRVDRRVEWQQIGPYPGRHHDLFQRRIARALADPVDRALQLAHAGQHGGQRIGDRQPEVVVAVAPAAMAVPTTWHRKSMSVRIASSAENSTSSV